MYVDIEVNRDQAECANFSPDTRLWEESHFLKVVGSNPSTVYWKDIFHIYFL